MPTPNPDHTNTDPRPPLQPGRHLAIPIPGRTHTFEEIARVARVNALCGCTVCVLCLNEEIYATWLCWTEEWPASLTLLDVLDSNRATLRDWQRYLRSQPHNMTILHGACAELQAGRVAVSYVAALVDAVPSGIIVVA